MEYCLEIGGLNERKQYKISEISIQMPDPKKRQIAVSIVTEKDKKWKIGDYAWLSQTKINSARALFLHTQKQE